MYKKILLTIIIALFLITTSAYSASALGIEQQVVNNNDLSSEHSLTINQQVSVNGHSMNANADLVIDNSMGVSRITYRNRTITVSVDSNEALNKVKKHYHNALKISEPSMKGELVNGEEKIVYEYKVERKTKLLGFIPVNMVTNTAVDVTDGSITEHNPWWASLTKED